MSAQCPPSPTRLHPHHPPETESTINQLRGRDDGRGLVGLVIGLALLAGLAVAVDRVAAVYAERAIASQLKTVGKLGATPGVSIDGWPFLTQLAARRLARVDITTVDYRAGDVTLAALTLELHDAWRTDATITAARVDGTADISLAELQRIVGKRARLSIGADGLRATATALGQTVTGIGTVSIVGKKVRVVTHVTQPVATTLPPVDFAAPELPWDIAVTDVQVTSTGLRLHGTARNVELKTP